MGRKKERYVIVPDDNVFNLNMDTQSFGMFRSMHRHLSDHGGVVADLASATAGSSAAAARSR